MSNPVYFHCVSTTLPSGVWQSYIVLISSNITSLVSTHTFFSIILSLCDCKLRKTDAWDYCNFIIGFMYNTKPVKGMVYYLRWALHTLRYYHIQIRCFEVRSKYYLRFGFLWDLQCLPTFQKHGISCTGLPLRCDWMWECVCAMDWYLKSDEVIWYLYW